MEKYKKNILRKRAEESLGKKSSTQKEIKILKIWDNDIKKQPLKRK